MTKRALQELVTKVMLSVPLGLGAAGCGTVGSKTNCGTGTEVTTVRLFDGGSLSGVDPATLTDAGALPAGSCLVNCPPNVTACETVTRPAAADGGADAGEESFVACHGPVQCVGGRRPEGLAEVASLPGAGGYLARMAHLEAASVPAFHRLADELEALDAPLELVQAARAAAGDEVFHARAVGALARRFGGEPPEPEVAPFRPRGLLALAEENAVEGCVGETYGALVAAWQAAAAADPRVRGVMRAVAEDELRHAELAWAVSAWAEAMLPPAERERVVAARGRAVAALESVADALSAEDRAVLGLPDAAQVRALLAEARRSLWS